MMTFSTVWLHGNTFHNTQVKILQLQLAKLDPLHTVQYISEQAQAVLQHHAVAVDNLDARGLPTWKSEASTAWSTFAALAKGTVVGLPHWCTGDKVKLSVYFSFFF